MQLPGFQKKSKKHCRKIAPSSDFLFEQSSVFDLTPTLVVSAAAVRGLWAQAVPVPVVAHVFCFGFSPQVISQRVLFSGPGQSFGHVFSLLGRGFGNGGVIFEFITFMAE